VPHIAEHDPELEGESDNRGEPWVDLLVARYPVREDDVLIVLRENVQFELRWGFIPLGEAIGGDYGQLACGQLGVLLGDVVHHFEDFLDRVRGDPALALEHRVLQLQLVQVVVDELFF
jgi:hypothetical protein